MSIKRYGVDESTGTGGQKLPFAKAVEAAGWLYVSGQTPMRNGEVVEGGIVEQSELALQNCLDIMQQAGYSLDELRDKAIIEREFSPQLDEGALCRTLGVELAFAGDAEEPLQHRVGVFIRVDHPAGVLTLQEAVELGMDVHEVEAEKLRSKVSSYLGDDGGEDGDEFVRFSYG